MVKVIRCIRFIFAIAVPGLLGLLSLQGCESSTENIDQLREVCFEAEILPIMQISCATANCHDVRAEDGYRLDSYAGIMEGIVPFNPAKSKIYSTITSTGEEAMPPDHPLSAEARMLIRVWIQQGAAEIVCEDSLFNPPDTVTTQIPWSNPNACFERDILPLMISSCGVSGCHDPITMKEEFNFTTYQGILQGLKPGNPGGSKIYMAITEVEQSNLMPPAPYSRLTQAQVDTIYNWILRGAINEDCGAACDTVDVTFNTHLASIINTSCKGCHSGSSPQGGIKLENYTNLVAAVNNGSIPSVLSGSSGYPLMPPFNPLSDCSIREIEIWIENGMPE